MGTKWITGDVITFARMNQKTLIVQAAEPAIMYPGMMWFDTDDDVLLQKNNANNAWATIGPMIKGTFAARPAFGYPGRVYWATDTEELYWDTGAAWDQIMQSVAIKAGDWGTGLVGISGTAVGRAANLDELDFDLQGYLDAIDVLIDGVIADIGVFPSANYATLAAYVEDIRARLIVILADVTGIAGAAMRGTDGAALVASGWDAGLATILDNFTAGRITNLDDIDPPAADTGANHTITVANDQVETEMFEVAKAGIYSLSIYIDVQTMITADEGGLLTFRLYNQIDATNYRCIDKAEFRVGTDDEHPTFELDMVHDYCKVMVICSTVVGGDRLVPYRYIVRDRD